MSDNRNGKADNPLLVRVRELSESSNLKEALREWTIGAMDDLLEPVGECLCTHTGLRYEFTMVNEVNGRTLYPVGSECIYRFGESIAETDPQGPLPMISAMDYLIKLNTLQHALVAGEDVSISSELYSRKFIRGMQEESPDIDAAILLHAFNARSKSLSRNAAMSDEVATEVIPYVVSTVKSGGFAALGPARFSASDDMWMMDWSRMAGELKGLRQGAESSPSRAWRSAVYAAGAIHPLTEGHLPGRIEDLARWLGPDDQSIVCMRYRVPRTTLLGAVCQLEEDEAPERTAVHLVDSFVKQADEAGVDVRDDVLVVNREMPPCYGAPMTVKVDRYFNPRHAKSLGSDFGV